jgi:hypothetical protein
MSDVVDFEGRRTAELLKREATTLKEIEDQALAAYEVGMEAALDMLAKLSEHDVDNSHATTGGAMTGVLYAVIRCAFDVAPSADIAREFISRTTEQAAENREKGQF